MVILAHSTLWPCLGTSQKKFLDLDYCVEEYTHMKFLNIFPNCPPEGLWTFYAPADDEWKFPLSRALTNTGRGCVTARQTEGMSVMSLASSWAAVRWAKYIIFSQTIITVNFVSAYLNSLFISCAHFDRALWICGCLKIDLYPLSRIANMLSRLVVLTLFKAFCFALLYKAFWFSGNQIYEAFS